MNTNFDISENAVLQGAGRRLFPLRYDLMSLFLFIVAFMIALGCIVYFGFFNGFIIGSLCSITLLLALRRWKTCIVFCIVAFLIGCFVFLRDVWDISNGGAYAKSYNHRMEQLALDAKLIGREEYLVEEALGRPSMIYSGWNATDAATGEPAKSADFVTTYKYSPYMMFQLHQTFEVHCSGGKVR